MKFPIGIRDMLGAIAVLFAEFALFAIVGALAWWDDLASNHQRKRSPQASLYLRIAFLAIRELGRELFP